jgi:hypothetical protein
MSLQECNPREWTQWRHPPGHVLTRTVEAYTGRHIFLALLPLAWQMRFVARAWLRETGMDPRVDFLIIQRHGQSFLILDASGRVGPVARMPVSVIG